MKSAKTLLPSISTYIKREPTIRFGIGWILISPILLFAMFQPEKYVVLRGNGLDNFFYTGYAFNLDYAALHGGDRHYFVSRWTAYLPMHWLDTWFSISFSRLLWRYLIVTLILTLLFLFAKRARWSIIEFITATVVLLTVPIFARALFTDYVEYTVIGFGIVLVLLVSIQPVQYVSYLFIGLLSAVVLIANPYSALLVIATTSAIAWYSYRQSLKISIIRLSILGVSAVFTVLIGLLYFRIQYDISNIYKPTINFIKEHNATQSSVLRNGIEWRLQYTWIYVSLIALIFAITSRYKNFIVWNRYDNTIVLISIIHVIITWIEDLLRNAGGLQFSFYFSATYATTGPLLAVVIVKLLRMSLRNTVLTLLVWSLILLFGLPSILVLPNILWLVVGVVLAVTIFWIAVCFCRQLWTLVPLLFSAVVLIAILGSPSIDERESDILEPHYDEVFRQWTSTSNLLLEEIQWLLKQEELINSNVALSFIPSNQLNAITGVFEAHILNGIVGNESGLLNSAVFVNEMQQGFRDTIVIYGPASSVNQMLNTEIELVLNYDKVSDINNPNGLNSRLVVLEYKKVNSE